MDQLTLSLEPGLLDRFPKIEDVLVTTVYSGAKAQKSIAYDLDESPSSLSRKIKGDLEFPVSKLPALIESTGDVTVIHWLIEKFLVDSKDRQNEAITRLSKLVPEIVNLIETARGEKLKAVK